MNKKYLSLLVLMLFIGSISMLSSCGNSAKEDQKDSTETGGDKPIVLRYAFFAPATTFPAKQMEKFKEEIEKRTDNRVKVDLFPGGTLLTDKNMYDGVKNGVAEIGMSSTTYEPGRFPLLAISDLPSGYPNASVASLVVYDLVQEYPPEAFKDFKIITAFCTEPNSIMVKNQASSMQDLKGKKIRISGSMTPILTELGATPVGMSMAEVPEALQTGIIEGIVSSREVLKDFKVADKLQYAIDYPLNIITFVAVMNKDVYYELPQDVQEVIDELGREMALYAGETMDKHVKESLEWSIKEHGLQIITLSPQEKEAWDNKLQPLQDKQVADLKAKGMPAEEYKDRLYELIDKYSKE